VTSFAIIVLLLYYVMYMKFRDINDIILPSSPSKSMQLKRNFQSLIDFFLSALKYSPYKIDYFDF